ncbi:MAG TPA: hypothetical protein HA257_08130 [Candidatus Methanoperedenaceae archaeon]|nr:hypothetical protein [Candidatus Methanoperedenaceae archaeon]
MRIIPILLFAVVVAIVPMTTAAPYLNITAAQGTVTIRPGEELSFPVTVKNIGNSAGDTSIRFPIENGTGMQGEEELPHGIHVVNYGGVKRLVILSSATFNVTIGADDNISAGVYTITIAAVSSGSPDAKHNLTIIVPTSGSKAPTPRASPTATPTARATGTAKQTPAFEGLLAIAAVLLIVSINRWK